MNKIVICVVVLLTACVSQPESKPTLFQRLGGIEGTRQLVDVVLVKAHEDDRIGGLFENIDHERLRQKLVEQLCQATGGPCVYTGMSMELAHKGLLITDEEFDFFVEDLVAAMNEVGVPPAEQNELAAILLPMRPEVVGK